MPDTKAFDATRRCKHCGDLKKDHRKRAPYKCVSVLIDANWEPWETQEEYDAAEKAAADRHAAGLEAARLAKLCPFCHVQHMVIVPTVHSNGTNAQELHDQLHVAVMALGEAQRQVEKAAPNGRDYYPQGDFALGKAMNAHEGRWAQLDVMIKALTEQRDHVQAVLDFQEAQRAERQEVR